MLTPAQQHLISLLADGAFHSGTALGQALGMHRGQIHQHIQYLQCAGLDIFAVRGKGYCLFTPLDPYDMPAIQQRCGSIPINYQQCLTSSNTVMLDNVAARVPGETLIVDLQTAGRGRRGKSWISPFGCQLLFSLYWPFPSLAAAQGASLGVGVLLVQALEQLGYLGITLKWPNDLYFQGKKLGGILVEGVGRHMVIGVGINVVLAEKYRTQIDQPCSTLHDIQHPGANRTTLMSALIPHLHQGLAQWNTAGLTAFTAQWNAWDDLKGKTVRVLHSKAIIEGQACGINAQGELQILTPAGLHYIQAGEVSVRLS